MKAEQVNEERLLKQIDPSGIQEWSKEYQEAVRSLIKEFSCVLLRNDLDLRKTAVKHKIKLNYYTTSKEHYRHMPPRM